MTSQSEKILLLSPSFFGGGAERILSNLYNYDSNTYDGACFLHDSSASYLSSDINPSNCLTFVSSNKKCLPLTVNKFNIKYFIKKIFPISIKCVSLIKLIQRIKFLYSLSGKYKSIVLCDYSTLYILLFAISFSSFKPLVVFRPSIDLDYINNIYFADNFLQKYLNRFGLFLLKSYNNKKNVISGVMVVTFFRPIAYKCI